MAQHTLVQNTNAQETAGDTIDTLFTKASTLKEASCYDGRFQEQCHLSEQHIRPGSYVFAIKYAIIKT